MTNGTGCSGPDPSMAAITIALMLFFGATSFAVIFLVNHAGQLMNGLSGLASMVTRVALL
jgi:hypothetical protein